MILLLQQPSSDTDKQRWRLIERHGESNSYCVTAQGEGLTLLSDLHLSNPSGKYGMPGSGFPRCAGELENGLPGSLDVRLWANKELGDSLVFSLPTQIGNKDYIAVISADTTGAWVILDMAKSSPVGTCYYARGDSSAVVKDVKGL